MKKQQVVLYDGPILRRVSETVTEINDEVREFVAEMFRTIRRSKGLGLSAPQVGVNKRVFILDLSSVSLEIDELVCINPRIAPGYEYLQRVPLGLRKLYSLIRCHRRS